MSTDRETTHAVRSWLEDGVTRLPDRVLDAVLDQVPATPQRRPLWRAWRFPNVTNPVRYAIAAAAVLVVALIGYQFLPTSDIGAPPSAAPTASPSPAATVTPLLPLTDSLAAGTYRPYPDLDIRVDAPAGWSTCCENPAWIIHKNESALVFFEDYTELTVHQDPCNWKTGPSSEPRGAEAIANAIAAQDGSLMPAPEATTVGGRPAFHVRVAVPAEIDQETCDEGQYTWWAVPGGSRYAQGDDQIEDVYILDVDGRTLGFDLSHFPDTPAADVAAIEAILASVQIP
jgi:hypothetical protein